MNKWKGYDCQGYDKNYKKFQETLANNINMGIYTYMFSLKKKSYYFYYGCKLIFVLLCIAIVKM